MFASASCLDVLHRLKLLGASAAETQRVRIDRSVLSNDATRGWHRHTTHRARPAVTQYLGNTHIPPRRRVMPYRRNSRVFSLSLAALPSDLGKGEDMLSPSCPRRPAGQNVGLPWSQRVAWESPRGRRACRRLFGRASGPRARAVSSSFARRPSVSKQQHR